MCHFSRPGILHMNDAISYIFSSPYPFRGKGVSDFLFRL